MQYIRAAGAMRSGAMDYRPDSKLILVSIVVRKVCYSPIARELVQESKQESQAARPESREFGAPHERISSFSAKAPRPTAFVRSELRKNIGRLEGKRQQGDVVRCE